MFLTPSQSSTKLLKQSPLEPPEKALRDTVRYETEPIKYPCIGQPETPEVPLGCLLLFSAHSKAVSLGS